MVITFSNIDNRKQIQRKKRTLLIFTTYTNRKKKEICLYKKKAKKLLFQLFNFHLEGNLDKPLHE